MRALAAVLSLAKNAVPALGVVLREWAAPGALLLYLGENVVLALLAAAFMILKTIVDLGSLRPDAVKRRLLQV